MNTYITFDPVTTLVQGVVFAMSPPENSLPGSQVDIDNFKSTKGVTGWTVENSELCWPTLQSLLLSAQHTQKSMLRIACAQAIFAGFSFPYQSSVYTITLREDTLNHDQSNLLGLMISANFVLMGSKLWQPNTQYAPSSFCNDANGIYYVNYTGGLSGAQEPTWPTEFITTVYDNTITWYKMGFRVSAKEGRIIVDPKNIIALGQMFIAFKNQMQGIYDELKAQVSAAATIAEVQAITWPNS